jgi:hypothetical protein
MYHQLQYIGLIQTIGWNAKAVKIAEVANDHYSKRMRV